MFTLNCRGRLLSLETPVVMGIINTTPDSFFTVSRAIALEEVVQKAGAMLAEGAGILDLGGQSTRPGSDRVDEKEEADRVVPAIKAVMERFPEAIVSVDTFYASVAEKAVLAGASLVNDVSGGTMDPGMIPLVGSMHVPYICMHMKGTPQTMHQFTQYQELMQDILDHFIERMERCQKAGIRDIVLDPGFGFAKTMQQNFELMRRMGLLSVLQKPILAGISRKGMVWKTLGIRADEALNGTTVLNTVALLNGANMLRVHDVAEATQAIRLVQALR